MRQKSLETILVLVLALGLLYWLKHNNYFLLAAAILAAIGLLLPALAQQIHVLWMKLGEAMGAVTGKIVLAIVFFIVLVPLSFISKLFGQKTLAIKSGAQSYFKNRNFTYNKDSMENVW